VTRTAAAYFVETLQYQRFRAFCDECRRFRCIGLCYGQSGVGKTLSGNHSANWDKVSSYQRYWSAGGVRLSEVLGSKVVFYTLTVKNTPAKLADDLSTLRGKLRGFLIEDLYRRENARLEELDLRVATERQALLARKYTAYSMFQGLTERASKTRRKIHAKFDSKQKETRDPTELIIIDEADRFTMPALKEAVALFDRGGVGMVLMGLPGLEKRILRYPQIGFRIGFVHEFQPLSAAEVYRLLRQKWWPAATLCPGGGMDAGSRAAIMDMTGGNFRQLYRLLQQIGYLVQMAGHQRVTRDVVAAAWENMVMLG